MADEETLSVTRWIQALKQGRAEAASVLWDDYWDRLVRLARARLQGAAGRAVEDEEDVALSAFLCLCKGAADGRFDRLTDRDDLWRLLVAITGYKLRSRHRRHDPGRPGRTVLDEAALAASDDPDLPRSLDSVIDDGPGPDADEQRAAWLRVLPEDLRAIATWKLEGHSNEEIAGRLGRAVRTVERKLERIRAVWIERAFEDAPSTRNGHLPSLPSDATDPDLIGIETPSPDDLTPSP